MVDAVAEAGAVAERLLAQWDVPLVRGRLREALARGPAAGGRGRRLPRRRRPRGLEPALLVRRLRPDVRLVVRMANPQVGHALAEVVGEGCVLDVAALAAPSIVEICLGRRVHELTWPAASSSSPTSSSTAPPPCASSTASSRPWSSRRARRRPCVCPSRDAPVRPGDRVTAVGTLAQFAHQGVAEVVEHLRPTRPRSAPG